MFYPFLSDLSGLAFDGFILLHREEFGKCFVWHQNDNFFCMGYPCVMDLSQMQRSPSTIVVRLFSFTQTFLDGCKSTVRAGINLRVRRPNLIFHMGHRNLGKYNLVVL